MLIAAGYNEHSEKKCHPKIDKLAFCCFFLGGCFRSFVQNVMYLAKLVSSIDSLQLPPAGH